MNFDHKFFKKAIQIIGVLKTHGDSESKKNICCNNDTNYAIIPNRGTWVHVL